MSAQPAGVFGVGTDPPPDSTLPSRSVVICDRVRVDLAALGLGHLADLLLEAHAPEEVRDALGDRCRASL